MDEPTGIGKVVRDITQAYVEGLSTIGRAIGDLGLQRMPESERQIERWIGVARIAKDSYVAMIDQGFAIWERQIRRALGRAHSGRGSESKREQQAYNLLGAWTSNWRDATEAFMDLLGSGGLSEEARRQVDKFRKALEAGLKALQD